VHVDVRERIVWLLVSIANSLSISTFNGESIDLSGCWPVISEADRVRQQDMKIASTKLK
jgi:hypothetical protein